MSLKQQILEDLKTAMKAGDTVKRDTLRMFDSMIKNVEIEKKKREEGLSDEEVQEVAMRAVKQRRDAMEQYKAGGREDLVEKEQAEVEILLSYMPSQMSEAEATTEVEKIIADLGVTSKADIGKVMSAAMGALKGKVDGTVIRKIVEEKLQ